MEVHGKNKWFGNCDLLLNETVKQNLDNATFAKRNGKLNIGSAISAK